LTTTDETRNAGQSDVPHSARTVDLVRLLVAAAAALATTAAGNAVTVAWLRGTDFDSNAFYDGCCALLTLVIPSLAGGTVAAVIARAQFGPASFLAFLLFSVAGLIHPFWQIPRVSPQSAHSLGMHYFLYNPLVTLPFGMASAWITGQLITGKWRLEDDKPVLPD
jgi:hypothetical protein